MLAKALLETCRTSTREILNGFKLLTIFEKRAPSQMFDWVENRGLAENLKY